MSFSLAELQALLQALGSADNQLRGNAEQQFVASKAHPNVLLPGLVQTIKQGHADPTVVLQAAIQLKRCLSEQKEDPYDNLTPENKSSVHSCLLEVLVMPLQNLVRAQVNEMVSALGSRLLDKKPKDAQGKTLMDAPGQNLWPELLPFLFQAMSAADVSADIRCSVLQIVGSLCQTMIDTQLFRECMAPIGQMIDACLTHTDSAVRKASVSATSTIAQVLQGDEYLAAFANLVPKLMECVSAALNEGKADDAKDIITDLTVIAEATSDFFVKSKFTNQVINAMLQVATTESFPEEIRHSAVEFMISFAEADSRIIKKVPGFVDKMVPFLMSWMVTPSDLDDPEWGNTIESDDDITNYDVGMEGLDRLAVALGGTAMARALSNHIQVYLGKAASEGDWKYLHAAILAMSQTAEGCKKQFTPNLAGMVASVVKEFNHAEPRVRYVAVQCIAQFCTDFQPDFQVSFASLVLPAVIKLISDPVPRVRHHAACTVVNFCDNAEPKLYEDYMKPLLEALYLQLQQQGQPIFIYDQILSSVSAVAENSGEYFKMFYDEFTPVMQHILAMPEQNENRQIKGKAIECMSFLALSVGKERFAAPRPDRPQSDYEVLIGYMVRIQQALQSKELEDDDPRQTYLTSAWGRIAKCIGDAFAQYLPAVLQPLLQTIVNEDDVEVLDNDEEADDDQECIRLALKGIGEKKLAIRTSVMEEKVQALAMLIQYFTTQREQMYPFIQDIVKAIVPCLSNPYIEEIRELSVQIIPLMLVCTQAANPGPEGAQLVGQLLQLMVPEIIKAIREEAQASVAGCLLENLNESIETCGQECVPDAELQNVMKTLQEVFEESLQRRGSIGVEQKEQEDDEDEQVKLDEQAEAEEHLLTQCVDCCGKLMKTNHRSFIAMFTSTFLPYFTRMLDTEKFGSLEHRLSLCLLDDFLEYGQDAAAPFFNDILGALHSFAASSQDPDVVQAAVYGLGVCAQWVACKPAERPMPEGALPNMISALNRVLGLQLSEAKAPFWAAPKCNSISALLKILEQFRGQPGVSDAEILPGIFPMLPCTGDEEEARIVHQKIFAMVAAGNPVVIGEGGANLPGIKQLGKVLLETADGDEPLINKETAQQLAAFIQQA